MKIWPPKCCVKVVYFTPLAILFVTFVGWWKSDPNAKVGKVTSKRHELNQPNPNGTGNMLGILPFWHGRYGGPGQSRWWQWNGSIIDPHQKKGLIIKVLKHWFLYFWGGVVWQPCYVTTNLQLLCLAVTLQVPRLLCCPSATRCGQQSIDGSRAVRAPNVAPGKTWLFPPKRVFLLDKKKRS